MKVLALSILYCKIIKHMTYPTSLIENGVYDTLMTLVFTRVHTIIRDALSFVLKVCNEFGIYYRVML